MANATTYTDEYRLECADYVISSGRHATEVAKELGVHDETLQRWVKPRREQLGGGTPSEPESAEVRELRKRVRELEQENEFLKKRAPSSPPAKQGRQVSPDEGGEGQPPREDGVSQNGIALWC